MVVQAGEQGPADGVELVLATLPGEALPGRPDLGDDPAADPDVHQPARRPPTAAQDSLGASDQHGITSGRGGAAAREYGARARARHDGTGRA
ncbi:hypothetical protein FMEAI12_3690003 [Parafrankia sp. Ea1.12]|nr:hypothetical protein FMEAI12_3690003 [Parafrankia sp. Ea1.12]